MKGSQSTHKIPVTAGSQVRRRYTCAPISNVEKS